MKLKHVGFGRRRVASVVSLAAGKKWEEDSGFLFNAAASNDISCNNKSQWLAL